MNRKWRNKVWTAKDLHWLRQHEGTYTIKQIMEKFDIPRHSAWYIVEKHKFEFIKEVTGFKPGNQLMYLKKSVKAKYENIPDPSIERARKAEFRKLYKVATKGRERVR